MGSPGYPLGESMNRLRLRKTEIKAQILDTLFPFPL